MAKELNIRSLHEIAKRHVCGIKAGQKLPAILPTSQDSNLSGDEGFASIVQGLLTFGAGNSTLTHEALLVGEAYLRNCVLDWTIPENRAAAIQLQEWTIGELLPTDAFAVEAPFATEPKPVVPAEEIARIVAFKEAGLRFLSCLQRLRVPSSSPSPDTPTASLMACLASITNLEDPWTNEESYHLARSMLSGYVSNFQKTPKQLDLVVRDLLVNYIKPLFLKHQTPLLTPAARKAISPLPRPLAPSDFESANKPWKFNSPHIVTIFQWILSQLSPPLVEAHWPLIIPPLLTIIDDVSVTYKIKGCSLLLLFLKVCPANLLERSGLGEIFHDTLMPYLLYLPSLTPEEESIPLLDATYDALIALTLARWGTLGTTPSKNEALDSVFRYGILKGYAHAGENVRIARILMEKSADLVNAMGIYCVKHLKDLLPLVSGILTAPFATAYPPLLEAVTLTLRAIVSNAWPRIRYHGGEILRGLIIFCDRVDEEDELTDELVGVKGSIEDILHAVVRILRDDEVAEEGLQMLSKHDSRVDALLRV